MGGDSTLPFRTGRRGYLKLVKKERTFSSVGENRTWG